MTPQTPAITIPAVVEPAPNGAISGTVSFAQIIRNEILTKGEVSVEAIAMKAYGEVNPRRISNAQALIYQVKHDIEKQTGKHLAKEGLKYVLREPLADVPSVAGVLPTESKTKTVVVIVKETTFPDGSTKSESEMVGTPSRPMIKTLLKELMDAVI